MEEQKENTISETDKIEIPEEKTGQRSYWEFKLFVGVALLLAAVIGTLIFLSFKNVDLSTGKKTSIQNLPSELTTAKMEATSTAETSAADEKSSTSESKTDNFNETPVKILNGGAPAGSAGKLKDALAAKGYKKITAGNSGKSNYSGTTIFYQPDTKAAAEKILADLKAKYPAAQIKLGVSSEEKSSAVVIILGK